MKNKIKFTAYALVFGCLSSIVLAFGFWGWVEDAAKTVAKGTSDAAKAVAKGTFDAAKAVGKTTSDAAKTVAKGTSDAAKAVVGAVSYAGATAEKGIQSVKALTSFLPKTEKPVYCPFFKSATKNYHSIDEEAKRYKLSPQIVGYIKKYTPIFYLHKNEVYSPISAEEYFTNPSTALLNKTNRPPVLIPPGQVTMEKIGNFVKEWRDSGKTNSDDNQFFVNNKCVKFGSNPAYNLDSQGNLITPAYLKVSEDDQHVWLRYLLLYGFNGAYTSTGVLGFNAHWCDLEHVSVVVSKATGKIDKIYFGSHRQYEGMWLNANNRDITWEGTHPIVFLAMGAHGNYPQAGIYVRVYGFANDITDKGIRWTPTLSLIFSYDDPRYDPSTMSWLFFPGNYGSQGVQAAGYQSWWNEESVGRPYKDVLFCPQSSTLKEKACLVRKIPFAKPPK